MGEKASEAIGGGGGEEPRSGLFYEAEPLTQDRVNGGVPMFQTTRVITDVCRAPYQLLLKA
jgi:hypothetical protein